MTPEQREEVVRILQNGEEVSPEWPVQLCRKCGAAD